MMENEYIYREEEESQGRRRVVALPEKSGGFALFYYTPT